MSPAAELVVFGLDQRRCALMLGAVVRVVRMAAYAPMPGAPAIVLGVLNVAGEMVPVLDVRRRFSLPPRAPGVDDYLLIARTGRRLVALPIDRVEGLQTFACEQVVPASEVGPGLAHVRGVVKLAGADVIVIQDLDAFLSLEEEAALDRATQEARSA